MESPKNPTDDLIGTTLLERFHITGKLGQGGMGSIYTAHDSILARDVAIKTIARTNLNDQELMRFQREAKAASTFSHPNVIQLLDFGVLESGQPFMVMELIEGIPLNRLIADKGPQSPRFVLQVIEQIANGMLGFHKAGIVHRDLKTGNIMLLNAGLLTNQPLAKILDFGIAKALGPEAQVSTLTKAGQIFGSPNSMSPEQARGDSLDHRTDIYSLGCVAFELLTGRPVFVGESVIDIVSQHINDPPPRLWEACDLKFPMELERLVAHMVLKDPDERFQSMDEVIKNLRDVYAILPDETLRVSAESPDSAAPQIRNLKLNSGVLVTAAVFAVLALIGSVYYIFTTFTIAPRPEPPRKSKIKTNLESGQTSLDFMDEIGDKADFALHHAGKVTKKLEMLVKSGKKSSDIMLIDSEIAPDDTKLIAKLEPMIVNLANCTGVTEPVIKGLSTIPSIQFLNLQKVKGLTPASLAHLQKLPHLNTLSLIGCDLTNEHLKVMRTFPSLRYLRLSHNKKLTLDGFRNLGGRKRMLGIEVDQHILMSLTNEKREALKEKNKIALFKPELQEEMSVKEFEKIGGYAMDDFFGPVGKTRDNSSLHDALQKTIDFE